jgi:hypothetical protein
MPASTSLPAKVQDMSLALLLFMVTAASFLALHAMLAHESRVVLSTVIPCPEGCVFEVIDAVHRTPAWRLGPRWLPGPLRISALGIWGDESRSHLSRGHHRQLPPDEIVIRSLQNREFSYRCSGSGLNFESTFRIFHDRGGCFLSWEIRYRLRRLPDVISRHLIAAGARRSMAFSLEHIRRSAVCRARPDRRTAVYDSTRNQVATARQPRSMAVASTSAARAPITPISTESQPIECRPVAMANTVSPSAGVCAG